MQRHGATKRLISNAYSAKSLSELEHLARGPIKELLGRLDQFCDTGELLNLSDWLQWFAFDVIGHITFSQHFGLLEGGKDPDGTLQEIMGFTKAGAVVAEMPELASLYKWSFFSRLPIIGKFKSSLNFLIIVRILLLLLLNRDGGANISSRRQWSR